MATSFTPPPVSSWQGQNQSFTPPPVSSWQGESPKEQDPLGKLTPEQYAQEDPEYKQFRQHLADFKAAHPTLYNIAESLYLTPPAPLEMGVPGAVSTPGLISGQTLKSAGQAVKSVGRAIGDVGESNLGKLLLPYKWRMATQVLADWAGKEETPQLLDDLAQSLGGKKFKDLSESEQEAIRNISQRVTVGAKPSAIAPSATEPGSLNPLIDELQTARAARAEAAQVARAAQAESPVDTSAIRSHPLAVQPHPLAPEPQINLGGAHPLEPTPQAPLAPAPGIPYKIDPETWAKLPPQLQDAVTTAAARQTPEQFVQGSLVPPPASPVDTSAIQVKTPAFVKPANWDEFNLKQKMDALQEHIFKQGKVNPADFRELSAAEQRPDIGSGEAPTYASMRKNRLSIPELEAQAPGFEHPANWDQMSLKEKSTALMKYIRESVAEKAQPTVPVGAPSELEDLLQKSLEQARAKGNKIGVDERSTPEVGAVSAGEPGAQRGNQGVPEPSSPTRGSAGQAGTTAGYGGARTRIPVPGEPNKKYDAIYELRELDDVQPSHSGHTFQENAEYARRNDRDYTKPENQRKIIENAADFEPRYLITDNPDLGNGPPAIDSDGNVLGGNSRVMTLQRVYASNRNGAEAYRNLLRQDASRYGIDPAQVDRMKQPVLVRQIPDLEDPQRAVTDFNKVGTAELRPSEKAVADSRMVQSGTLEKIGGMLEAEGPEASLADLLSGSRGHTVFKSLVDDGVITPQEQAAYIEGGKLTASGKTRIERLLLGRFFADSQQMDRVPPSVNNRLARLAGPLARIEADPQWSLTPKIRSALTLVEDARAHGMKIDDYLHQSGLFGEAVYPPEVVSLARGLIAPKQGPLIDALRQYGQDAGYASGGGGGLFGDVPTPADSLQTAIAKLEKDISAATTRK